MQTPECKFRRLGFLVEVTAVEHHALPAVALAAIIRADLDGLRPQHKVNNAFLCRAAPGPSLLREARLLPVNRSPAFDFARMPAAAGRDIEAKTLAGNFFD